MLIVLTYLNNIRMSQLLQYNNFLNKLIFGENETLFN